MMTVGRLARKVGLSRTALLYYHRIGLLKPAARSPAGYRLYGRAELERLRLIRIYAQAGLELDQIGRILDLPGGPTSDSFKKRIAEIDLEVAALRAKQALLIRLLRESGEDTGPTDISKEAWVEILDRSGMDQSQRERWHAEFEQRLPRAHHSFLLWLGIPEEEAEKIRKRARTGGS
jgi:DNA-binding transcriptional MerR regulator